jgi:hypothetical protein
MNTPVILNFSVLFPLCAIRRTRGWRTRLSRRLNMCVDGSGPPLRWPGVRDASVADVIVFFSFWTSGWAA